MRNIRALVLAAVLATALTSAPNAWACTCILDPLDPSPHLSPATSPISFIGVAGSIQPRTDPAYRTWAFQIEVPLRGSTFGTARVELFNADDGNVINTCSLYLEEGTRYQVYGDPGPSGDVRIDSPCGPGGFNTLP